MPAQCHRRSENSASTRGHVLLEALLSLAVVGLGAVPLAMFGTIWLRWTGEQERLTTALTLAAEQAEVGALPLPAAGGNARRASICRAVTAAKDCASGNPSPSVALRRGACHRGSCGRAVWHAGSCAAMASGFPCPRRVPTPSCCRGSAELQSPARIAQRGATLPELLIALALAAVLAVAAFPVLRNLVAEQSVAHVADRLATSLALARTTAASRRAEIRVGPLAGASTLDGGWQLGHGAEPPLAVVVLGDPCLRITLRSTAGPAGPQSLRLTAVGYSRSEQGGFQAATFQLRCHQAQRQVRLGAQGRIRICRPGVDVDCD